MKILYLLPPSEGKTAWWEKKKEKLSFPFDKPSIIAQNATQKDLKCTGKRYEEGISLNTQLVKVGNADLHSLPAIHRYSWGMYNAINYSGMSKSWKEYFEEHFLILSGMYGILRPQDYIGDYKLPIETKGLVKFWDNKISDTLNTLWADYIIDFLPLSYKKMICWKNLQAKVLQIDFFQEKDSEIRKMTHWVKKVKGEYIQRLCEKQVQNLWELWEKIVQISENQYHLSIILDTK